MARTGDSKRGRHQRAQGGRTGSSRTGRRSELEAMSKTELYSRAKEAGIPGRSSMNKEQLIRALSSTRK